jgi:hypothetical protein
MQPHGFHGSGRTTDIAGMTGFNEDDPNALKKGIQSNNRLRFLGSYQYLHYVYLASLPATFSMRSLFLWTP